MCDLIALGYQTIDELLIRLNIPCLTGPMHVLHHRRARTIGAHSCNRIGRFAGLQARPNDELKSLLFYMSLYLSYFPGR